MMAGTARKIYPDPEMGEVTLRKSVRAKRISIRVHPVKGVSVTMPYRVPYIVAIGFFKLKHEWVREALRRQTARAADASAVPPQDVEALRDQAKAELPGRLAELAARYGFIYNRVTIKNNSSNWGSCSASNNINLNLNIVRLPKALQDYVLLHELCHLRHHDHGPGFHQLLEHVLTDNLLRLVGDGDPDAVALAGKISLSRAGFPADYVMTREIRKYRL